MSKVLDCRLAFEFRRYNANIQRKAAEHARQKWVNQKVARQMARDMQVQPEPPDAA